ncbi:cell division protein [Jeongeupia sp. HS-3]|nr:cell division protein [Jeongeupia sp. HS-3]
MARDMKKTRASSNSSGGGSLITGLVVGLLGGVAVAVGVALFLNRSDSPFSKQVDTPPDAVGSAPGAATTSPEVLHPGGSDTATPALPEVAAPAASAPEAASGAERFDFYKVLPELNKNDSKPAVVDAKPAAPVKKAEASPPAKVEAPKGAYLQVGAFQNEQEADNLKAKLALLGTEATIQSSASADKGLWHRVRIGPFTSLAELDKARAHLKNSGIDSSVVKGN